jgi:hypothetical protein
VSEGLSFSLDLEKLLLSHCFGFAILSARPDINSISIPVTGDFHL